MRTASDIMLRMGFPETENGPYVAELRAVIAQQVSEGMVDRSAGSWAPECFDKDGNWTITHEARAKEILAWEWEIRNGHSCEQKVLDDTPLRWTLDVRTMRWSLKIKPSRLLSWLGDRWREFAMDFRIWRDRDVIGRVNPYR